METPQYIKDILKRLPSKPGVYRFYDSDDDILYVGKAKNLKNRVSSYFNKIKYESGKTKLLVRKICDIKFIVVDSEFDALLLENSLIKKHQPRYNIMLKDDKTYPSIVIKKERFPRVFSTRNIIRDGSEYYGPYASVKTLNTVLTLVRKMYPIRDCKYNLSKENVDKRKYKICLEYHMGNCLGPCEEKMSEEKYDANISSIRQILKGKLRGLTLGLKEQMATHAENLQFEEAQKVKSRLDALKRFQAKSTIVNYSIHDVEVYTLVSDNRASYVNYMKVNEGVIVNSKSFEMRKQLEESDSDMLRFAILNTREEYGSTSKEIYLSEGVGLDIPDVKITIPLIGDKKKLLELSKKNAFYYMKDKHKQVQMTDPEAHQKRILTSLQKDLRMTEYPDHIECFDNSNIQGTNPSSACVVFKNAKPSKKDYRKFNIKTVVGPDDFASMEEVVYRRYKRLKEEEEPFPQLIIIDGGKGQLSSSLKALEKLELRGEIAIIGIAKKLEEIYFPGDSLPLFIDKRSESLKLIQQLRNEAHRFSLSHHRDRRSKEALRSELTEITGVGFRTAQELLWKFKSVNKVKEASLKELEAVVNKRVARSVWEHFNK